MASNNGEGAGFVVLLLLAVAGYYGYQRFKDSWNGPSPIKTIDAPKRIVADGVLYIACEGSISVYSPPRDIVASGGEKKLYEVVFTDDFGQQQDLKDVSSYEIAKATDAQYAIGSYATESNTTTAYADGTPIHVGDVVLFRQGKDGRARWNGVGKWAPVPCGSR